MRRLGAVSLTRITQRVVRRRAPAAALIVIAVLPSALTLAVVVNNNDGTFTLSNAAVSVTVTSDGAGGNRPGEIVRFVQQSAPTVNAAAEGVFCGLKAGLNVPLSGTLLAVDSLTMEFRSLGLRPLAGGDTLPLSYSCRYALDGPRLRITMQLAPHRPLRLPDGLELDFHVSPWSWATISNHYRTREVDLSRLTQRDSVECHLDSRLRFHTGLAPLHVFMRNPAWSRSLIERAASGPVYLKYFLLQSEPPITYNMTDMTARRVICSDLIPGDTVWRELEIALGDAEPFAVQAFFSPHPHGFDQTITAMWDEIAGTWWGYATDSSSGDMIYRYVLKLLMRRPRMKMGYLITYDGAFQGMPTNYYDQPLGPTPWERHGQARLSTHAPAYFREWLRDIEAGTRYEWSPRMKLGTHAYHHDRLEGDTIILHEFGTDDSVTNFGLMEAAARDMDSLGLTGKSRRFIRFPGFKYSLSALQAAIHTGHVFYDNGKRFWAGRLSFFMSLYHHNGRRAWGTNTCWWGDYSDWPSNPNPGRPYEYMDYPLAEGKVCLVGAHPGAMFNECQLDSNTRGLQRADSMFALAEQRYPDLGYLFPDEVADCWDELYGIRNVFQTSPAPDSILVTFTGRLTQGQTLVVPGAGSSARVWVDGTPVAAVTRPDGALRIVLPSLSAGNHTVAVGGMMLGIRAAAATRRNTPAMGLASHPSGRIVLVGALPPGCAHSVTVFVTLCNAAGRQLWGAAVDAGAHADTRVLPVRRLPPGCYSYSVQSPALGLAWTGLLTVTR